MWETVLRTLAAVRAGPDRRRPSTGPRYVGLECEEPLAVRISSQVGLFNTFFARSLSLPSGTQFLVSTVFAVRHLQEAPQ